MMKDIKIVIGGSFGDEGKGLITNYFSQKKNSIVICSNGGAQRGHTVTSPDGIRHVFHHFGSGTFNGAATYLPEDFILNPIMSDGTLWEGQIALYFRWTCLPDCAVPELDADYRRNNRRLS